MGIEGAHLINAKVMHKRTFPKENQFSYGVFYFALPLEKMSEFSNSFIFSINRFALLSFFEKDYGPKDGQPIIAWCKNILEKNEVPHAQDLKITLITMPRIFGYSFNPVSFYLCHDADKSLKAVICEVNNTFGEHHIYLCTSPRNKPLTKNDAITSKKLFHVSPFLERKGHYTFRFEDTPKNFGVWIDYYNEKDQKQLVTSLLGTKQKMTRRSMVLAFIKNPLLTFKVISLIHYQAVKLLFKKAQYVRKPEQLDIPEKEILKQQKTYEAKNNA